VDQAFGFVQGELPGEGVELLPAGSGQVRLEDDLWRCSPADSG
jgi:hypothetical protein